MEEKFALKIFSVNIIKFQENIIFNYIILLNTYQNKSGTGIGTEFRPLSLTKLITF